MVTLENLHALISKLGKKIPTQCEKQKSLLQPSEDQFVRRPQSSSTDPEQSNPVEEQTTKIEAKAVSVSPPSGDDTTLTNVHESKQSVLEKSRRTKESTCFAPSQSQPLDEKPPERFYQMTEKPFLTLDPN